jgi:DNA-binding Xre family transcriptional regulator
VIPHTTLDNLIETKINRLRFGFSNISLLNFDKFYLYNNIEELDLDGVIGIYDNNLHQISKNQSLKKICLKGLTTIHDLGIKHLICAGNLRVLKILNCPNITNEGIYYLQKFHANYILGQMEICCKN